MPESGRFSTYEINKQWNAILSDFRNFQPMVGAYLEGSLPFVGAFEENPLVVRIRFSVLVKHHFDFFAKDNKNRDVFQEYLEIVLNRKVALDFYLDEKVEESEIRAFKAAKSVGSVDHQWQMDKEDEPIILKLEEIFKTEFRGTHKSPPKGEIL